MSLLCSDSDGGGVTFDLRVWLGGESGEGGGERGAVSREAGLTGAAVWWNEWRYDGKYADKSRTAAGLPIDAVVAAAYCVSAAPVALETPAAGSPKSSSI